MFPYPYSEVLLDGSKDQLGIPSSIHPTADSFDSLDSKGPERISWLATVPTPPTMFPSDSINDKASTLPSAPYSEVLFDVDGSEELSMEIPPTALSTTGSSYSSEKKLSGGLVWSATVSRVPATFSGIGDQDPSSQDDDDVITVSLVCRPPNRRDAYTCLVFAEFELHLGGIDEKLARISYKTDQEQLSALSPVKLTWFSKLISRSSEDEPIRLEVRWIYELRYEPDYSFSRRTRLANEELELANGHRIYVNKAIVTAYSEIFREDHGIGMRGHRFGVKHHDADAVLEFLRFIYPGLGGRIRKDNCFSLLKLAILYDVPVVRQACREFSGQKPLDFRTNSLGRERIRAQADAILMFPQGKEMPVCRPFLAHFSSYFYEKFYKEDAISRAKDVDWRLKRPKYAVYEVDFADFRELMEVLSPCRKPVSAENVGVLLNAADCFGMPLVTQMCAAFLRDVPFKQKLFYALEYRLPRLREECMCELHGEKSTERLGQELSPTSMRRLEARLGEDFMSSIRAMRRRRAEAPLLEQLDERRRRAAERARRRLSVGPEELFTWDNELPRAAFEDEMNWIFWLVVAACVSSYVVCLLGAGEGAGVLDGLWRYFAIPNAYHY